MLSRKINQYFCYYRTIKYLKPVQLWGRVLFKLYKPRFSKINLTKSQKFNASIWLDIKLKYVRIDANYQFKFLSLTHNIHDKNIWKANNYPKLWLYNLHYFDEINAENSLLSDQQKKAWIYEWIAQNPPAYSCGWESYPLSLRIVNWIKWCLSSNSKSDNILESLIIQANYLSKRFEFHLQGNHLLVNAKALIYAGLFFDGKKSKNWLHRGMRIFEKQITEQILEDGGHFELSPMYHALILEDFLDLINLFQSYHYPIPKNWISLIQKMFDWLEIMSHPDGEIAFFNDAVYGIALPLSKLKIYASSLGLSIQSLPQRDCIQLLASGYARLQNDHATLILDAAAIGPDYLPGHAHADTLSFELSLHQQRVIVNSGISRYDKHIDRLKQRGTVSHNTVLVDQQNSSEVWSSFRVGRRAKIISSSMSTIADSQTITASHDGYKFMKVPSHQRTWKLDSQELQIIDELQGKNIHECQFLFHLHPEIVAIKINSHVWDLFKNNICLATFSFDNRLEVHLSSSTFHPYFGSSIKNYKLVGNIKQKLPIKIKNYIQWKITQ